MRLSEWRMRAPVRDALGTKVMAVVTPVLGVLDGGADPETWVVWGDDPATKYSILVPTPAGLIWLAVRVNLAGLGPRATAKVIRWQRLQLGELVVETEGPHRMVSFQVESAVLRGADEIADSIGRFALVLLAAVEGRPWPPFDPPRAGRAGSRSGAASGRRATTAGAKPTSGAAKGKGASAGRGAATTKATTSRSGPTPRATTSRTTTGDWTPTKAPKLPALPARTATSTGRGRTAGRGSRG